MLKICSLDFCKLCKLNPIKIVCPRSLGQRPERVISKWEEEGRKIIFEIEVYVRVSDDSEFDFKVVEFDFKNNVNVRILEELPKQTSSRYW